MKLRTGDPWMPGAAYGATLSGISLNLLVRDVPRSVAFAVEVLGTAVVYADPDFAVVRNAAGEWQLHADHTYDHHALGALVAAEAAAGKRGLGAELRLHGIDPDAAAAAALRRGDTVLSPPADKGHGLRECFILDPDGYTWVPDVPVRPGPPA